MSNNNITETRIASVYKDENDIIIIKMKDCGRVDEYDVVDLSLVQKHVTQGKPALKLVDGRANWSLDKKARERAKLVNTPLHTIARAMIVSNLIKATLFRFLNELGKNEIPQKFFTEKEEAYKWLLSYKEKSNR